MFLDIIFRITDTDVKEDQGLFLVRVPGQEACKCFLAFLH